jgi:hypothetical protein
VLGWGPDRPGGRRRAACRARASGTGAAARAGPFGLAASFFFVFQKLKIQFEASKKIRKMQIRYRWIHYEKCFNVTLNLKKI